MDFTVGDSRHHGPLDLKHPLRARCVQRVQQILQLLRRKSVVPECSDRPAATVDLQGPETFLPRLLERPPDGHGFSHGLHLCRERAVGGGEFLEGKPRAFHHHIVEDRLE